ncbi:MAG: tetratricopeptide repeat protein, partial [Bacteroidota bacterium]
ILRHLYAKDTTQVLKTTIHSLVKYVNNPNSARQDQEARSQLLPHGRLLFERLDTDQYSPEAYTLAEYLTAVCRETCLFPESATWAEECLRLIQKRYPNQDQPEVAYSLNRLGASLVETAQHEAALSYKQRALDMRRRLFGSTPVPFLPFLRQASPDHEDIAYSLSEVGGSLAQLGRHEEALAYKRQSLEMRQRLFGEQDHPEVAHSLSRVGELLSHLGNNEESLGYKLEALAMLRRLHASQDHPDIARSLTGVGISLESLRRYAEALQRKKEALAIYQRLYKDKDHPSTAHALNNVGETLIKAEDPAVCNPEEGKQYCQQALDMRKRLYPDQDHLQIAHSRHCVGLGSYKLGDVEDGLADCKEALSMAKRLFPDPERPHAYMRRMVADLEKVMNSREELIELCREMLGEAHSLTQQLLSRDSEEHVQQSA